MTHHQMTVRMLLLLVCLLLLGGLVYYFISSGVVALPFMSSSTPAGIVSQAPATSTSLIASSTPGNSTIPASPTAPVAPSSPKTPPTTPASALTIITNADNNSTITLKTGQDFGVNLGDLHWTLNFSPSASVEQIAASSTAVAQGTFKAVAPGIITLKATGAPICKPGQACPMFLAVLTVTIDVQ
jgi:hypothetical protein